MNDLSPAAQAVFQTFNRKFNWLDVGVPGVQYEAIAAVIHTIADHVVPEYREHYPETIDEKYRKVTVFEVRDRLLAIAKELEEQ